MVIFSTINRSGMKSKHRSKKAHKAKVVSRVPPKSSRDLTLLKFHSPCQVSMKSEITFFKQNISAAMLSQE